MKYISRAAAHAAMKQGKKIAHMNFTSGEFYCMTGGRIIADDNVDHTTVFFSNDDDDWRANGWYVIDDETPVEEKEDKIKVYISGKITGLPIEKSKQLFATAETMLNYSNVVPINPMKEVPYVEGKTWEEYMLEDIKLLFGCNAVYMLPNWMDSKGARIEHAIAKEHGLQIIYEQAN